MAAMTTALTEFSNSGNSRTSTLVGHLATSPRLVIEKRVVPTSGSTIVQQSVKVVYATTDAESNPHTSKISFEIVARYPIDGQATDVASALGIISDIVSGDEYANSVNTQEWLT